MRNCMYRALGRASVPLDWVRLLMNGRSRAKCEEGDGANFDKTGVLLSEARPLDVLWEDSQITYVEYESLAHSFWRAQELSLFSMHKDLLLRPLLDLGCGDGSFASVLFEEIDYGLDNDPCAIRIAEGYKIYHSLLQTTESSIPLGDDAVNSIISNSVFEHLTDVNGMLSECHRVLRDGGIMIFTVPVAQFERDLAYYVGWKTSRRINREYYHHNLLEPHDWVSLLHRHGFTELAVKSYQPNWFTFWYWMFRFLGKHGIGRVFPGAGSAVWNSYQSRMIGMVRESIVSTDAGGGLLMVAKKASS